MTIILYAVDVLLKGIICPTMPIQSIMSPYPVGYELIKKPSLYCDIKTRKKRKALKTKNEYFRTLLTTCCNKLE